MLGLTILMLGKMKNKKEGKGEINELSKIYSKFKSIANVL